MNSLELIEKLPLEIAVKLSQNEKFQRLLVIDSPDVDGSSFQPMGWESLINEGYLSISPIVFEDYTRKGINTFSCVILDELDFYNTDNNISVNGRIYIGTNYDRQRLSNNELRLLKMISEIKNTIDNCKFSISGKLEVTHVGSVAYSQHCFGYIIEFKTKDQEEREIDI